ncbi:MAG: hypothetical protein IJS45_02720 [Clostridia bacterium]|nr:hypothetical protein [Clostridia bacterium]
MNGDADRSEPKNEKNYGLAFCFVALAATVGFAAISAAASLYFTLAVSAAFGAYLAFGSERPIFAACAVVLSFGVIYIISKDVLTAAKLTGAIILAGASLGVCKKFKLNFFKSSFAVGAVSAAVMASLLAVALYSEYGSVAEGVTKYGEEFRSALTLYLRTSLTDSSGVQLISDNLIEELVSLAIAMIPGIAAAIFEALGAASYMLFKLICRFFKITVRAANEYKIPRTSVVFFAVSAVLAGIFSIFNATAVAELAALNICFALSLPTLFDGIARLVDRFKNPPVVNLPDGKQIRRSPVLPVVLIAGSAIISPIFPIILTLVYSVWGTIKEIIVNSKKGNER